MGDVSLRLLLGACVLFAVSGIPRARVGMLLAVSGALLGLAAAALSLSAGSPPSFDAPWPIPIGRFSVAVDALSAAFLLPVLVVPALGAVYASAYFPASHPSARRTRIAYGVLPAAMIVVVAARDAFLLLVAWEVMALAAFFLVVSDEEDPGVRESGWIYLVATHLGTLCLVAAFSILSGRTGTLALAPAYGVDGGALAAVAVLFLVGFGMKAGIMPLHVWLPGAHADAPSHVSAVMSGVVLKMGIYGLIRTASLLPDLPAAAGAILLALGVAGAVLGAVLAVAQSDLKRLLAYSSVDNMGIVAMALGLAMIGRATGRDDLLVLGIAGAVLHVWNHSMFKPLLFFSAGAVVHATGTRSMDRLGGLARSMPTTAAFSLVGAIALAGLPPLNGFVGEFLVYAGLIRSASGPGWPALAAPALALTGGLAVLAMVKLHGSVFLGEPRGRHGPHDPPWPMSLPMGILACGCLAVAPAAAMLGPVLARVAAAFARRSVPDPSTLAPLRTVAIVLGAFTAATLVGLFLVRRRTGRGPVSMAGTWDCGYAAPTARIQYTSTSFSGLAVGWFDGMLRPGGARPAIEGVFPPAGAFSEVVPDPVLDRAALPAARLAGRLLPLLRRTQQGNARAYILYILLALLALFAAA
jgi:hydrogenase-4 component B